MKEWHAKSGKLKKSAESSQEKKTKDVHDIVKDWLFGKDPDGAQSEGSVQEDKLQFFLQSSSRQVDTVVDNADRQRVLKNVLFREGHDLGYTRFLLRHYKDIKIACLNQLRCRAVQQEGRLLQLRSKENGLVAVKIPKEKVDMSEWGKEYKTLFFDTTSVAELRQAVALEGVGLTALGDEVAVRMAFECARHITFSNEQSMISSLRPLFRRAGSLGETSEAYVDLCGYMSKFLQSALRGLWASVNHRSPVTVTADDVNAVLQRLSSRNNARCTKFTVYGFGGRYGLRHC